MNLNFYFSLFVILLLCLNVKAQPAPANPQSQPILISGATAHIGNGQVIENSAIAFENGKITLVADATTIRIDGSKYQIIEANGKHIYPGFISPNTNLGLVEIGAVRATSDYRELGQLNPNIRSIIAYNTDSKVTPTVRSNGVLLAQVVPQGGRISGSSSVVELDAWNWEDAAYHIDEGIHLNWPQMRSFRGFRSSATVTKNEKYNEQVQAIEDFFKEAKAYTLKEKVEQKNLKFEAMRGLFNKTKTFYVHTNTGKTMTAAVLFAKKYNLKLAIVGARDAWMLAEMLAANNVAVILRETQSLPGRTDEDIDQPFKTPKTLQVAGVLYCLSIDGGWQQRNLPFQAGQAVGFGLKYEEAIQALTLNTAKILGIDKTVGTLEAGKDATLIVSEGDALDMIGNNIQHAFIRGKAIDLDNKQKELYRKYKQKYGH